MRRGIIQTLMVTMTASLLCFPGSLFAKAAPPDFVELARTLKPAVVNISTTKIIGQQQLRRPQANPFGNDLFDDFFGRFFQDQPQRPSKQRGQGSGFIIGDGYIFTNNHVVAGADEIRVKLSDGREFKGQIKGTDEKLDLALLRIETKEPLPIAPLGDSDALEVGEWVMAIGNPFGLAQTVTAGIISAKGRWIGSGPYDDFLQTDASINPGNSGGPLFNAKGEVIGINTAIVAGGQGIGFAIPINMAKAVLSQLKETGRVTRGWLGVSVQPITPELAASFGMKDDKGALISEIMKGSPAEKAGIQAGDIILEFDGRPIKDMHELPRIAAVTPVGKKAVVKLLRDGKTITKTVTIERMADSEVAAAQPANTRENLGLVVADLSKELAAQLRTSETSGVVVMEVKQGSAAHEAGLAKGDIIRQINGSAVSNRDSYAKAVATLKKGDLARFLVRRGETALFIAVKVL
jgi:serine protease Do